MSPGFFEHVAAALLLLVTAIIATVWVMIQLDVFPMPLLATVLQLIEQCMHANK